MSTPYAAPLSRQGLSSRRAPLVAAVAAVAFGAFAGSCGSSDGPHGGPNVLLVTLDTTRADALSCYGRQRGTTPNLDALAAEGERFTQAYTSAPLTLPAHASMLTGLYPLRHGVRENGLWPLSDEADTLAERAREAGYDTAAFLAAVVLDERFGLDQGFAHFDTPRRSATQDTSHYTERDAASVVDAALAWFDRRQDERPFFTWVHVFDPHAPYAPPEAFRQGVLEPYPYLGELAYVDAELGRLFDTLRARELFDDTVVLVVGDHGEAFGEHGEVSHGPFCYESTLRVPFLLRDPRSTRRGVSEALVSVVDVHPTLLAAMGLTPAPGIDGIDLGRTEARRRATDGVYFESYAGYLSLGWSPLAGWRDASGKYLHSSDPQLFDVVRDPEESRNLLAAGDSSADPKPYRLALAELAEAPRLARGSDAAPLDPALLDSLRGLGYTTTGAPRDALPDPLAPSPRPSPQAMAPLHRATLEALQRFNAGDLDTSMPAFEEVLAANPENAFVLDLYAYGLMRQGRHRDAVDVLERLFEVGPERPDARFNLGLCLERIGRADEARQAFLRVIELDPSHKGAHVALVRVLEATARDDEAAPFRERLEALLDAER